MIDVDGSDLIDQEELLHALRHNKTVAAFAEESDALRPLLKHQLFANAWKTMDTDDDDGVSLEEFIEFCLVLKEVCDLNEGM